MNDKRHWGKREERGSKRSDDRVIRYGWHRGTAALATRKRKIRKSLAPEYAATRVAEEGITPRVTPEIVRPGAIDHLVSADAVHQGLLAEADPLPSPDIGTLKQEGIVLVLD